MVLAENKDGYSLMIGNEARDNAIIYERIWVSALARP